MEETAEFEFLSNAGLWTCGVTYGFAPHTLTIAPPDVVVDSPRELAELFAQGQSVHHP